MRHSKLLRFVSILYAFLGITILVGAFPLFSQKLFLGAYFALFLSFVHFFIAWGIWHHKKWSPYLGMFFEFYLIFNFFHSSLPLLREHITLVAPISYGMLVVAGSLPILMLVTFIMSVLILKREHFIH